MLFCNTHVKEPLRKLFLKSFKPGSLRHRSRDCRDRFIFFCKFRHSICKYICVGRPPGRLRGQIFPRAHRERPDPMKSGRFLFRIAVTLSLLRDNMNNDRLIQLFCPLKGIDQKRSIMPVDRADISDSHVLKHHARNEQLLDGIFGTFQSFGDRLSDDRDLHQ